MRNLRNTHFEQWKCPDGKYITATAWDLASDSILCTLGPTESDPVIELARIDWKTNPPIHKAVTTWDAPCPNPDLPYDEVLSLHYFGDSSTVCLVLAGGDIVVVREDPLPGEDRIEIIGSIDEGITAAKWSPDEELLAITTRASTVVFMSRSFEGVMDVTMTSDDLRASNHVSVGWGKKETQFQGKGAKALKDPTMPEKTDQGVLSPNDDSRSSISWRGDGAFLAISTIQGNSRRIIRVYSREGVLDSVSEPVDGLEGALSWRPAGNLIAGIQRLENRVDVVFFERNGLRHGQFSLRLTPDQVQKAGQHIKLQWNSDSTVLAVVMADHTQLWTMGNYHWYLKQEYLSQNSLPALPMVWHPEKCLRLIMASANCIRMVESVFTTARASTTPPQDYGVVAVIDGQSVKLTPLRSANIPPPMALHDIELSCNAIDVAFSGDASSVAVLHHQGVSIYEWQSVTTSSSDPHLIRRIIFDLSSSERIYQQVSLEDQNVVILARENSLSYITRYGYNNGTGRMELVQNPDSISTSISSSISTLSSYSKDGSIHLFVQSSNGHLQFLAAGEQFPSFLKFPLYLPWVDVAPSDNEHIAFGMSSNGHLYANSRLLVKNCTSFLITPAHLIFTTTTHLLKFVHNTNVDKLEVPQDDPEVDERCRRIERGARLVTAIPTALSLVLQMPRGNLETIYPRAMVLAGIRKLIDEKNYKKAFIHCRTQRVDMNLLYDHAPQQLLSSVSLFVDQVRRVAYIDLFLSSLREDDVTQTMYKETRALKHVDNSFAPKNEIIDIVTTELKPSNSSKVNRICNAFLEVLKDRTATNLQNIITANVCKSPPALDDGLTVVAQLMNESSKLVDDAVEHICFLADVNKLYEHALGLYNLELALLIVQKSQKDPREYLPFMHSLQQMDPLRRQFSIDDYLGRHTKALAHLHALNSFSELQKYTQKHNLYAAALNLCRYNPSQCSILTSLYAAHLESKSAFSQAALTYESLGNYSKATSCYLSSGPTYWRHTFYCALSQIPPVSGSALTNLATSLYDALIESKDYYSAGTIQFEYLKSIPNACRAFCKGYFFADAFHLIALKQQTQLLREVVDPGLGEAFGSSTELLAECKAQLQAQVPRIRELRSKALADPLAFYEGERGGAATDLPDDVSVAASSRLSTNQSLFTRYTGKWSQGQSIGTAGTGVSRATSKNRKREERKRARGKKGSIYEQEYLVNSVERLVSRVESVRGEVARLIEGLVRRGMWERARAVEGALSEVVSICETIVPEVFGSDAADLDPQAPGPGFGGPQYQPVGADAVLQESINAIAKRRELPIVTPFKKMSLLD